MDFTVRTPMSSSQLKGKLKEKGLIAGIPLAGLAWFTERDLLLTVTEVHTKEDIDRLVDAVEEVLWGGGSGV